MPFNAILSVNAGSSSIKLSLYESHFGDKNPKLLLESTISKISSPPAIFTYKLSSKNSDSSHDVSSTELNNVKDHSSGFSHFLTHLSSDPRLSSLTITHTLHRVVHGGTFPTSQPLSSSTISAIKDLTDLAPLHNTPALSLVNSVLSHLPKSQNIAYFDTSFHRTLPPAVTTYAIPRKLTTEKGIRRYGFHGISYSFILRSVAEWLNKPPSETSIIALHLGSGCSAVAIKDGESVDTTMGLTPLEGLPGATRSGDIDPSAVFHFSSANRKGLVREDTKEMHVTKAEEILNKECGWKAMTGTADFGEVLERAGKGDEEAALAVEVVVERVVGVVGSFWVKLGGEVDTVVFSGGVGEKSGELRRRVVERLKCIGVEVDERNEGVEEREETVVEVGSGRVNVLVCRTDEQKEMVLECVKDERFWEGEEKK